MLWNDVCVVCWVGGRLLNISLLNFCLEVMCFENCEVLYKCFISIIIVPGKIMFLIFLK